MIEDSFESFEPKKGWPGHNGCALITSCVIFQKFSLFLPPLTVVESLDWVVSDFSVVNAQRVFKIPQGDFSKPRNLNVTSDLPKISGGTQFWKMKEWRINTKG